MTLFKPNQKTNVESKYLIPIIGAYDENGVDFIARYLLNEGLIFDEDMSKRYSTKIN